MRISRRTHPPRRSPAVCLSLPASSRNTQPDGVIGGQTESHRHELAAAAAASASVARPLATLAQPSAWAAPAQWSCFGRCCCWRRLRCRPQCIASQAQLACCLLEPQVRSWWTKGSRRRRPLANLAPLAKEAESSVAAAAALVAAPLAACGSIEPASRPAAASGSSANSAAAATIATAHTLTQWSTLARAYQRDQVWCTRQPP